MNPTIVKLTLVAALAFGSLVACKTTEEQLVGKPPEDQLAAGNSGTTLSTGDDQQQQTRPRYPDPVLLVETWPWNDDLRTFALTWVGGKRPVPLHERPDPNSPMIGDVVWKNGEKIRWQGTTVAVYQPSKMRAKEEWSVEGYVYDTGYMTDDNFVQKTVRKGQSVNVWLYNGSGNCFLGEPAKIFTGRCPPQTAFDGKFDGPVEAAWYQPAQKVWWIQISAGGVSGWFPVDDRVAVDFIDE